MTPTDSSRINRRLFLAPAFPMHRGQKHPENLKNLLPTLDIGSHSNARHEPRAPARRLHALVGRTANTVAALPVPHGRTHSHADGGDWHRGSVLGIRPSQYLQPSETPAGQDIPSVRLDRTQMSNARRHAAVSGAGGLSLRRRFPPPARLYGRK